MMEGATPLGSESLHCPFLQTFDPSGVEAKPHNYVATFNFQLSTIHYQLLKLRRPIPHLIHRLHVRSQENTRIDPDDGKAVNDKRKAREECQNGLVFVDVGEDEVFAHEGGTDREAGGREAA